MTQTLLQTVADLDLSLAFQVFAGDTTGTLESDEDSEGTTLPDGLYGLTVDLGQNTKEYIVCNLAGTALTGVVSIDVQGNATTGFSQYHRKGASVTVTDWTVLKRILNNLMGVTGFDAGTNLGYDSTPAGLVGNQFATVNYVLSVVSGGAVTFDQQVVSNQILGETISARDVVYFKQSDQRWWKADADLVATFDQVKLGFALTGGIAGGTAQIAISGTTAGFSGLTAGSKYYLSNTAGGISVTAGTTAVFLGWALSTTAILLSVESIYVPTAAEKTAIGQLSSLTGSILPYAGRAVSGFPISGYLFCDGAAYFRSTYAALFAVLAPSATFTVTIASPAVFSKVDHNLVAGDKISLTTTGALPTGLAANKDYYVMSTGLTANAFQVALTPAGSAVNTSGTQSGVHTFYATAWGKGDGSTTFNVPDLRAKFPIGLAQSAPTITLTFEGAQRSTNDITILDTVFPAQGQKVQLTTTGALPTGLSTATDYWIIRSSSTTIAFASTQANANAGTKISLTGDGSGVNTMTFTDRTHPVLGRAGGEETHGVAVTELAAHTHPIVVGGSGNTQLSGGASGSQPQQSSGNTSAAGGDTQHNNLSPFATVNYIIKT